MFTFIIMLYFQPDLFENRQGEFSENTPQLGER